VRRHDAIREQPDRGTSLGLSEDALEGLVIAGLFEQPARGHPALQDVISDATDV
jgi:hypothetical protein